MRSHFYHPTIPTELSRIGVRLSSQTLNGPRLSALLTSASSVSADTWQPGLAASLASFETPVAAQQAWPPFIDPFGTDAVRLAYCFSGMTAKGDRTMVAT